MLYGGSEARRVVWQYGSMAPLGGNLGMGVKVEGEARTGSMREMDY